MARFFVDLTPLRQSRDFRLLFGGQLVSMLGSQLTLVAIPYQIYLATHSSVWVGLSSLVQFPFLISASLWGGALGDQFDRRRIMIICALASAILSVGLALNGSSAHPSLIALFVVAALAAAATGFANPARSASIPRLVGPDLLVAAYSINQVVIQFATVLGPAVSGLLLAHVGISICYWLDAASFLAVVLASLALSPILPEGSAHRVSTLAAIGDGLRYVKGHVFAQCVYLVDLNAMIFGMPNALFPAMAVHYYHGGATTLGLLYSAPGAGALLGALTTGWVERITRRGRAVIVAVIVWGAAIALFGLWHSLPVGLVMLALAGWADVISAVLRNTILQSSITDEFRSRISSIQMAVVQGGPRLGNAEAGLVAGFAGTEVSVVSGGVLCIVGAVVLARWRREFWNLRAES